MHWFLSLEDAYEKINAWVSGYNRFRPHSSLNDLAPAEVVEQCKSTEETDGKNDGLLAASLPEAMYFAATEHGTTATENIYLQEEILTLSRSPISQT